MTLATLPLTTAPAAARSETTAPRSEDTGRHSGDSRARSENVGRALTAGAIVGGVVLAGIGFAGSYSVLKELGSEHGFGDFAAVFPIGLDAGIVVLLALDLILIRAGTPWPVLRLIAHLFTVATIVFNGASAWPDPIGVGMHAVIPIMFIASVEAARRRVIKIADIQAGRESVSVPLHRWLLAPWSTGAMYRRMRLWDLASYAEAVAREQELTVYRELLERKYGSVRKAPSDARLPLTMARFGLTVSQALALPEKQAQQELERREAEQDRLSAEEQRAEERAAEREKSRMRTAASVVEERHQVDAQTSAAEARARALSTAAERAAAVEEEALESAATAEARQCAAEADARAAEARNRAAGIAKAAAETERAAVVIKQRALEAEAAAAEATARKQAADKSAAEARLRAAEAREAAAGIEARALEMEDAAQLKPSERAARKVARMILATGTTNPEAVELTTIATALGMSVSTASERRREAADLIAQGYRL